MLSRRRPIRVATISHRPTTGTDTAAGTDRLMKGAELYLRRASRMGADLVAFPEIYPQLAAADPFITPSRRVEERSTAFVSWPAS